MSELERLQKKVVDTKSDTTAAAYANLAANSVLDDAIAAQKRAKQKLNEYLEDKTMKCEYCGGPVEWKERYARS